MEQNHTILLDALQAAVYAVDSKKNLIYLNPAAEKLSGYDRTDALTMKCWEVFGDIDQQCQQSCPACSPPFPQKVLVHARSSLVSKDGRKHRVSRTISPLLEENEHVGSLVLIERHNHTICQDNASTPISSGQEPETPAHLLLQPNHPVTGGPVVMFRWHNSPGWPVEFVSDNITQFGYQVEDFTRGRMLFGDMIHIDDIERVRGEVLHFSEKNVPTFEQEYRIHTQQGTTTWVYDFTRVLRNQQGEITHFDGYLLNITRRKELEASLQKKQLQYQEAQSLAEFGHWEFILPDGPVHLSDAALRLLGWNQFSDEDEIPLETYVQSIHPNDKQLFLHAHYASLATRTPYELEYRVIRPDNTVIHLYDKWHTCFTSDGTPTKCFGTIRNITERKRASEELHASKDMLNKVINTIPQSVFWKDTEGRYLGCNARHAALFGFDDPRQIIGLTDFDLSIPSEDAHAYRADDRKVIENNQTKLHFIEPIRLANGRRIWGDTSKAPLLNKQGTPIGVLGIFTDITEHKAMEEALQKRIIALTRPLDDPKGIEFEELFNIDDIQKLQDQFAQATKVAAIITRPDGTPITTPSNFCRLCGDIIRKTDTGLIHCMQFDKRLGDACRDKVTIQHCSGMGMLHAGTQISVGGHHIANWLIGQVRDVDQQDVNIAAYAREIGVKENEIIEAHHEATAMSVTEFENIGQVLCTLANQLSNIAYQNIQQARYIIDLQRTEEALIQSREEVEESHARLSLGMSMAQMAQWSGRLYEDTISYTFDDQFYSLYSTTAEQEGGYTMSAETYVQTFVHPDDIPLVTAEIEGARHKTTLDPFTQLEHRIIRRDGETRFIAVRYKRILENRGRSIKVIGVNQDITHRKRIEEKLVAAKRAAEDANQAKSHFLANMSHEIRTPLNGIMGMLQLLQMTDLSPKPRQHTDMAIDSCKRLSQLLGDILDLSRIEAGEMTLIHQPFTLQDVMESVGKMFGPAASQAGLKLHIVVEKHLPQLAGDSNKLYQILNNLVGNAIKFTQSGSIAVEASHMPSATPGKCHVYFEVSDTGIGIADTTLNQLFQPFTQVDSSFTRKYEGAGLGLSITKRLLDLMGGVLSVVSEPGRGSSFHFCIPLDVVPPAPSRPQQPLTAAPSLIGGLTVLLAEDDPINQMVFTGLAENHGCTVVIVENGEEVLQALQKERYHVVIMDIQMPVMDGLEATKAIRRGEAGRDNQDIPIIALTAFAMAGDKETFIEAGVNGYLAKPVDIDLIQQVLRHVLTQESHQLPDGAL